MKFTKEDARRRVLNWPSNISRSSWIKNSLLFIRMSKLPNVKGRIGYISSPDRQENLYATYQTADEEFWKNLAFESQQEFRRFGTEGKCIEAREPKAAEVEADNAARQEWNRTADMALLSGIAEETIIELKNEEIHNKAAEVIWLAAGTVPKDRPQDKGTAARYHSQYGFPAQAHFATGYRRIPAYAKADGKGPVHLPKGGSCCQPVQPGSGPVGTDGAGKAAARRKAAGKAECPGSASQASRGRPEETQEPEPRLLQPEVYASGCVFI